MLVRQKRNVLIIYRTVASVETQKDPVEQQQTDAHLQYNTSLLTFFFLQFCCSIRDPLLALPVSRWETQTDGRYVRTTRNSGEIPEKSGSPGTVKREITRTTKMKAIIHPARFSKPEYPPVHLSLHTKTQKISVLWRHEIATLVVQTAWVARSAGVVGTTRVVRSARAATHLRRKADAGLFTLLFE